MAPKLSRHRGLAAVPLLVALTCSRAHAQYYATTDLTALGGSFSICSALNNSGTVVGYANFAGGSFAFSDAGGSLVNLGAPPTAEESNALAINNAGTIAGVATYAGDQWGNDRLVSFNGGTVSYLGFSPSGGNIVVTAINDSGTIVGYSFDTSSSPKQHAFAYSGGSVTALGNLPGGTYSLATGINNAGTIVGWADDASGHQAVTFSGGTVSPLGLSAPSYAYAINNAGTVIGNETLGGLFRGVSFSNGVITDLGTLPGGSTTLPAAINSAGTIVGTTETAGGGAPHAFIYSNGTLADLSLRVTIPGVANIEPIAINDEGQILVYGEDTSKAYLLTPAVVHFSVSAPSSVQAGSQFTVTVSALDASGNAVTSYGGTLQLSSTDPAALLPGTGTLPGGTGTFVVTLHTGGPQTIAAADISFPSVAGLSGAVDVLGPPVVVTQPTAQSVAPGANATFSALASGSPAPTYQWTFNGAPVAGATGPAYTVSAAQVANSGAYAVLVSNPDGTVSSNSAFLTVTASSGGPVIGPQPAPLVISAGQTVVLFVSATANPASTMSYQWFRGGVPLQDGGGITGSKTTTLDLGGGTAAAGSYVCLVSDASGSVTSQPASLTLSASPDVGRLINVSCRANVGSGENILIAGFVIGGSGTSGSEAVLVRGSGPALAPFGVPGVLPDPGLDVYNTGASPVLVAANDGWNGSAVIAAAASSVGAFAWTNPTSSDAALLENLTGGAYTANISGRAGDTGVALAEVYDATPQAAYGPESPRLVNVSARIQVGTGANVLIAGFVIGGTTAKTVLIRASGPALAPFGVSGTLQDPELQLFAAGSSSVPVAASKGWGGSAQIAAASASAGAFSWGASATPDSAILLTLPPGAYTATVSGASGDAGVALVEVYDIP